MTIISAALAFAAPLARFAASPAYRELCRRVHRDDRPWFDLMDEVQRDRLREAVALGPRDRLLDLGCGAGALGAWLISEHRISAERVTGIDLALAAMVRTPAPRATAVTGDLTRLPFRTGTFEVAVAVDSFYFLADPYLDHAVTEALRCLRPGGRLVALLSEVVPAGTGTVAPEATRLGRVLRERGWACRGEDLTEREAETWRRKAAALAELRGAFEAEGSGDLWASLDAEARQGRDLVEAGRVRRVLLRASGGR